MIGMSKNVPITLVMVNNITCLNYTCYDEQYWWTSLNE